MVGKNEKIDMHDIPVYDYTREQNGSPYFSSIFRRSTMQMTVCVQKD